MKIIDMDSGEVYCDSGPGQVFKVASNFWERMNPTDKLSIEAVELPAQRLAKRRLNGEIGQMVVKWNKPKVSPSLNPLIYQRVRSE